MVAVARRRYVKRGLIESIDFTNYHSAPVRITVSLRLGADFADIFEVRGIPRSAQGHTVQAQVHDGGRTVAFTSGLPAGGKADPHRAITFSSDRSPNTYSEEVVTSPLNGISLPEVVLHYDLELPPHQPVAIYLQIVPQPGESIGGLTAPAPSTQESFSNEIDEALQLFSRWQQDCTRLETDSYPLARVYGTGVLDLRSLMQQEPHGLIVTAGLPWYFTLFGRDSLITALETLSLNPTIAVDTLRVLAAYQATEYDDWRDSEPGKILHELRRGDMTLSGEMPHSPYYGSVDSTPLFILLFAETLKWLPSADLFRELWPNVQAALNWAEQYGDMDRDGYIKFKRRSPKGILHQGWKDSDESMGGYAGPYPPQPLALVEVQGYYYAALISLSEALLRFGDPSHHKLAEELQTRAARLKDQFNRDFWWEEEGFFVQALDANNNQVRNISSNVGHCLWNGIVNEDKAARVVERLMRPDMISGWGLRTISGIDPTYNPMSYHNGSVWPHDNALAIAGLRRYGFVSEAAALASQLFDASATFEDYRLPELYCGFPRGHGADQESAPAAYPVSCSPQAWAAGAPMLVIQSLLDLKPDAASRTLSLSPFLPATIHTLTLQGLTVGHTRLDLTVRRDQAGAHIVTHRQHDLKPDDEITVTVLKPPRSGE
jgi:glycogen debranching enzyme